MASATRASRRALHGILLLDKPRGLSSAAALGRAKRLFNAAKAGHTGTLDPLASGLLPLCFGEATKFATDLLDADKAYEAELQLGTTTTTGDAEGEVLETRPVAVSAAMIEPVLEKFRGPISQVPPMHSALKRDGKPLYEYARAGVTLERAARAVTILQLEQLGFTGSILRIAVACSKGTYVRTLAEDIGAALGCGAHLTALRRTRVGELRIADALTLERLEALEPVARDACLLGLDRLLANLPRVDLTAFEAGRFRHGQRLQRQGADPDGAGGTGGAGIAHPQVRVYGPEGLLGLAEQRADGVLAPTRVIAAPGAPASIGPGGPGAGHTTA